MSSSELLGVSKNASASEIQKAFRNAAMEIHPDHSNSPEAAEAFARIKEARDELIQRAQRQEAARNDDNVHTSTAAAVRATTNAAYSAPVVDDGLFDGMTPEEVAHVQWLDCQVLQKPKRKSFFLRTKESLEVRRHRKKLKTNEKRIQGKY